MIRRTALILSFILACGCVSDAPAPGSSGPELDAGFDSGADGATTDPDAGEEPDAEPVCECPDLPDASATCNAMGECEYSCDDGLVACDPAEPGVCTLPSRTPTACGACEAIDCTEQLPVAVSEAGCAQEGEARCQVNGCEPGWLDVDGDFSNGCECPDPETFDITSTPIPFECDGFVERIIFVEQGAEGAGTSSEDPMGSLANAINRAQSMGRDIILVGQTFPGAVFSENVVIDARNGGLQIVGGRNPAMEWGPFAAPNTIVTGANPDLPTIHISNGTMGAAVAIHGITFEQVATSSPGIPSITGRITDTVEVGISLSDVHFVGGSGSDGIPGSHGVPGINGSDGADGADEVESATGLSGGAGGVSSCGVPGGKGGDSGLPSCQLTMPAMPASAMPGADGSAGGAGSAPTGGSGGDNVCASLTPSPGELGNEGRFQDLPKIQSGVASAEVAGSFVSGTWTPAKGGDGVDGANGPGGAGGGAGGSRGVAPKGLGGSGGGGGSGGCAGTAGGGGTAGSDSIALLLDNSTVDLALVEITYGLGGDGGAGGNGSCGGIGGEGGEGGSGLRDGGNGGYGINGSSGGGGAGGNGGATIAVGLLNNASTNNDPVVAPAPSTGSTAGVGGFEGTVADLSNSTQGAPATCTAFSGSSLRASSGEPGEFIEKHTFD